MEESNIYQISLVADWDTGWWDGSAAERRHFLADVFSSANWSQMKSADPTPSVIDGRENDDQKNGRPSSYPPNLPRGQAVDQLLYPHYGYFYHSTEAGLRDPGRIHFL